MNNMKEVAKILGVELLENFIIEDISYNPYCFFEDGLYDRRGSRENTILVNLLSGELTISRTILDDKEKEYLSNVIAPKSIYNNVLYITKRRSCYNINEYYINIKFVNGQSFSLPYFTNTNMYKNIKLEEHYTLQMLGLDKHKCNKQELLKAVDELQNNYDASFMQNASTWKEEKNSHANEFAILSTLNGDKAYNALCWIHDCYDYHYKSEVEADENNSFNCLRGVIEDEFK